MHRDEQQKTPLKYGKTSRQASEHYVWRDGCEGWHLVKQEAVSIIHERMRPGTLEVRHFHRSATQYFFILRGQLVITLPDARTELAEYEGLEIKPGVVHQVLNDSNEDAEFLVTSWPPSHGDKIQVD